ncbi:MAG: haloalkane dehalogenase [Solirubrobacterales bacterium]|nr:haloalkane dehalogenase [Solirubrobacterales bacterium]
MKIQRTPESRFDSIDDFPYEPVWREWEGLNLAHIDEGEGPPVLLIHGEPTWGYLWRKVMGPLLEAGYRCVVPDLPGFGRSDKPVEDDWFTMDRMVGSISSLVDDLELTGTTLVCHDWGGPIGLAVATLERSEAFDRLVAMDTGTFNGHQQMSDNWQHFLAFIEANPDVMVDVPIQGGTVTELSPEVLAAYAAPFPDVGSKAGVRALPPLIPTTPDAPGADVGQATMEALLADRRPHLLLWADSDPALPLDPVGRLVQLIFPNAAPLTVIENAGHFLQEDRGEEIGRIITGWLQADV